MGGPGLLFSFFPPPHATTYIFFLEFAKLLGGGAGPPGPLNAATPLILGSYFQFHETVIKVAPDGERIFRYLNRIYNRFNFKKRAW